MNRRPLLALAAPVGLVLAGFAVPAGAEPRFDWGAIGQAALTWTDEKGPGAERWSAIGAYLVEGTAENTTESGIVYGATVKVGSGDYGGFGRGPENNAKLTVAEAYLFAEMAYGRVRLGDDDGASVRAVSLLPTIGAGQMDGFWSSAAAVAPPAEFVGRNSDDATKIFYETPDILPVTLAASYAPERESLFEDIEEPSELPTERDFWEVALNWRGEVGPVSYELGAAWSRADARKPELGEAVAIGFPAISRDTESVSLAGGTSYAGFSAGFLWFDNGRSGRSKGLAGGDTDGLTLQATYENGPYGITFFRHDSEVEDFIDYRAHGLGLSWRAARTVTVGVDLVHWRAAEFDGRQDGVVGLALVEVSY